MIHTGCVLAVWVRSDGVMFSLAFWDLTCFGMLGAPAECRDSFSSPALAAKDVCQKAICVGSNLLQNASRAFWRGRKKFRLALIPKYA